MTCPRPAEGPPLELYTNPVDMETADFVVPADAQEKRFTGRL